MRQQQLIFTCLERLSFLLWIVFTIFVISLTGIGIEGFLFGLLIAPGVQSIYEPFAMALAGGLGVFLSIGWRQAGIDYFHYSLHDSLSSFGEDDEGPSQIIEALIREVADGEMAGRTAAREKAKSWLVENVALLDAEEIELAKEHFGYLLPPGWGQGETKRAGADCAGREG